MTGRPVSKASCSSSFRMTTALRVAATRLAAAPPFRSSTVSVAVLPRRFFACASARLIKTPVVLKLPSPAAAAAGQSLSLSSGPPPTAPEARLVSILRSAFPGATDVAVVDVSDGCGAMYEVYVEAPQFSGLRTVRQHQLVTAALREEIKDMHGLRISTAESPPPGDQ